jgi:hypothetical protein
MPKSKVASNISKIINKLHGLDKQKPLVEGVDYTIDSKGESVEPLSQEFVDVMRKRAKKIANNKGIEDMMSNPIMSATTPDVFSQNPKRNKKSAVEEPTDENEPAPAVDEQTPTNKQDNKESVPKEDPNFTTVQPNDVGDSAPKDSVADVAAKLYNFMVETHEVDDKKFKLDKKARVKLDKVKEKRTKQLIGLFKVKRKKSENKKEEDKGKKTEDKGKKAAEEGKKEAGDAANKVSPKVETPKVSPKVETPKVSPKVETPSIPKPGITGPSKLVTGAAVVGAGVVLGTAALVGRQALATNISKYESGSNYNAYNKGTIGDKNLGADKVRGVYMDNRTGTPTDFSKMTITEYFNRTAKTKEFPQGKLPPGHPDVLFAVGKYQIIPKTMLGLVKILQIDPDTTYLDQTTQDLLFTQGLTKLNRVAVDNYISGKSNDRDAAILELAKEFASVGVPYDNPPGKKLKKGESYYSGIGGNKAHNSPEAVGAALDADRLSVSNAKPASIPQVTPPAQPNKLEPIPIQKSEIPDAMKNPSTASQTVLSQKNNNTNVVKPATTYQISQANPQNNSQLFETQYG